MSMGATLSIMGLYNDDSSIFDLMAFPEGFTALQKETVRDNILIECAELEVLYSNPEVMKNVIALWSRKELPYWDRVYKASLLKYDPIENYHRTETEDISDGRTEKHSGTDTNTVIGTDINQAGGSDMQTGNSTSKDEYSGTDTETNSITGFDSGDLVIHDQSETEYDHDITNTASGTNTQHYGRTDTATRNNNSVFDHGENIEHAGNSKRSLEAFGNIGTMTSQDMLTQELEVAKIVNIIPIIIDSFKDRFCLLVY